MPRFVDDARLVESKMSGWVFGGEKIRKDRFPLAKFAFCFAVHDRVIGRT